MKTNTTFSVLFFTRKLSNSADKLSIYARITVNGKRSEISLKRIVLVSEWDVNKARCRGNTYKIKFLNAYLDEVYSKLLDCQKQLFVEGKMVSANSIKARFLGEDENHRTLRDIIEYHNLNMIDVLKFGTMKNYYTTEKYLYKFLGDVLKANDIYLKQLNHSFICDFEIFLRNHKNPKNELTLRNNGVMKHLERLKKIINLACKLEWINKNPFQMFQLKFKKFDRQYLSERELELIENTFFTKEGLERVKDCFLFACYTGLSYVDVKMLKSNHITRGIDNNYWIFTKREKTNETVKIPILPKALQIIKKYKALSKLNNDEKVLPLYSNQKINVYLKDIAIDCGIHKNLTFHVARHTFATTVMLSNGVPLETVSKLLGHTKLSTTQIYARVVETKISEDIDNLLQRFERKKRELQKEVIR
ncbi:site-specific integrase [Mariniflexile gromovii]|uniref:Site-specific integrase n=1 Tax=Mariniflexile gromovii TaxID=362523 RepID=A0ABS4BU07_9FLAO|nr:site-specific integrase [Mariniflexile gromovii]MBP0904042.1 site-specific integrase [Mariniflexile gromovii]